mmetsp:Transcript_13523/g.34691  ORF Transcript_13523/g.34691 Transcript_13523/m.34691 type:complete len:256 (-) Transcript_13523:4219-4986(-)
MEEPDALETRGLTLVLLACEYCLPLHSVRLPHGDVLYALDVDHRDVRRERGHERADDLALLRAFGQHRDLDLQWVAHLLPVRGRRQGVGRTVSHLLLQPRQLIGVGDRGVGEREPPGLRRDVLQSRVWPILHRVHHDVAKGPSVRTRLARLQQLAGVQEQQVLAQQLGRYVLGDRNRLHQTPPRALASGSLRGRGKRRDAHGQDSLRSVDHRSKESPPWGLWTAGICRTAWRVRRRVSHDHGDAHSQSVVDGLAL